MLITCSKCQTQLQIQKPIGSSSTVQCPQCQTVLKLAPTRVPSEGRASSEGRAPKAGKKRKSKKQSRVSATTWIIAGVGVVALVAIGLFALGLMGHGPLDFSRKDRIRDYCQDVNAKLNLLMVIMKENSPSALAQLFDSDKMPEHVQKSLSKIQQTRMDIEKKAAPSDCQEVKQAVIDMLQRFEKWAGEDVPRAREMVKTNRAGAERLMDTTFKDLRAAEERIRAEIEKLQKKYF